MNKFPRNVTNDIIFIIMPTKLLKHPGRSYIALPKNTYFTCNCLEIFLNKQNVYIHCFKNALFNEIGSFFISFICLKILNIYNMALNVYTKIFASRWQESPGVLWRPMPTIKHQGFCFMGFFYLDFKVYFRLLVKN